METKLYRSAKALRHPKPEFFRNLFSVPPRTNNDEGFSP